MRDGNQIDNEKHVLRLCGTEDMEIPKKMEWEGHNKENWGIEGMDGGKGPRIAEIISIDEPMIEIPKSKERIKERVWNYIVEPLASPTEARGQTRAPTGLSPLMRKVNLKRKYEEETDSETEEREDQSVKKRKGMDQGAEIRGQKSRTSPRGKKQTKKESTARRKIMTSKSRSMETGSGSCLGTATRD